MEQTRRSPLQLLFAVQCFVGAVDLVINKDLFGKKKAEFYKNDDSFEPLQFRPFETAIPQMEREWE